MYYAEPIDLKNMFQLFTQPRSSETKCLVDMYLRVTKVVADHGFEFSGE